MYFGRILTNLNAAGCISGAISSIHLLLRDSTPG